MATEKVIDWESVEIDYRAGILTLRELAVKHGGNHVAITRRAKKEGWVKDLSKRIQSKADELVTKRTVTADVTAERAVTEAAVIDANAQVIADIRLSHRKDISRSRKLAMALLEELELETQDVSALEKLGELLEQPDDKGVDKLRDLYAKIISLPSRTDTMKKLSETLKNLIGLEREAYGLVETQKLDVNANITSDKPAKELTKEELIAIATRGRERAIDS